jgi:hypothetical protein
MPNHPHATIARRGAAEDGERDAVLRPRVRVQNHRDEDDRVPEQDGEHGLPPVHALLDEAARERVGRNHDAHAYPQRRDVPGRPRPLAYRRRREVAVPQWAAGNVLVQLDEVAPLGRQMFVHACAHLYNRLKAREAAVIPTRT